MGVPNSRFFPKSSRKSSKASAKKNDEVQKKKKLAKAEPNFQWIGGRKYIDENANPYAFPVDLTAVDTNYLQHITMKHVLNGNYTAPLATHLRPGSKILDIGSGPGNWAIEIAQEYPDVRVIGIDIVSNFPNDIKPRNCEFQIADASKPLPFLDNTFDYVWVRCLFMAIRGEEWPGLLSEIKRVMKPNAIFEHHELYPFEERIGPVYNEWLTAATGFFGERGLDLHHAFKMASIMQEAGFVDLQSTHISIGVGKWGGKVSEVWANAKHEIFKSFIPHAHKFISWPEDEIREKLKYIIDTEVNDYRTYSNFYISWGRKD